MPPAGQPAGAGSASRASSVSTDADSLHQRLGGVQIGDSCRGGDDQSSSESQDDRSRDTVQSSVVGLSTGAATLECSKPCQDGADVETEFDSEEDEELPPLHRNPNRRVIVHDVSDSDEDA